MEPRDKTETTEPPRSVWSGSFHILGVEVKCHILSDGQRIIEADSMHSLLEAMASSEPTEIDPNAMQGFLKWRDGIDV